MLTHASGNNQVPSKIQTSLKPPQGKAEWRHPERCFKVLASASSLRSSAGLLRQSQDSTRGGSSWSWGLGFCFAQAGLTAALKGHREGRCLLPGLRAARLHKAPL